jgi:3',5'-cyclic AMP phosphodiesterase CpdA
MKHLNLFLILLLWVAATFAEVRVVVISDLNGSYGTTDYRADVDRAVERIVQMKPDLVISTGDMIAGQRLSPLLGQADLRRMWSAFHEHVTLPLYDSGLPLAVTPGNHDASAYGDFHLEREIFVNTWRDNKPNLNFVDDAHYPLYYAFEVRNVLFVSLDVTVNGSLNPRQKTWLRELFKDHGGRYLHKIVFSHLPLWPFAQKRENGAMFDEELEKILQDNRVGLYLSGHHHAYYPGFKDGIRYISQACLGAGPRKLIGNKAVSARSITLIGIPAEGHPRVQALSGKRFDQPVDIRSLPESIVSRRATLIREDLALPVLEQ